MKPSEIRQELIGQHSGIRARVAGVRAVAQSVAWGGPPRMLRDALAELADAVRMHNLREESLMAEVFPMLDGWARIREEVMREEHATEHEQLYDALLRAGASPDPRISAATANLACDHLLLHMIREERVFLAEDILTDEDQPVDSFGG